MAGRDHQNLIGFEVFIHEDELLGSVSEVIKISGQWLINVNIGYMAKNILIPFHKDFIKFG